MKRCITNFFRLEYLLNQRFVNTWVKQLNKTVTKGQFRQQNSENTHPVAWDVMGRDSRLLIGQIEDENRNTDHFKPPPSLMASRSNHSE